MHEAVPRQPTLVRSRRQPISGPDSRGAAARTSADVRRAVRLTAGRTGSVHNGVFTIPGGILGPWLNGRVITLFGNQFGMVGQPQGTGYTITAIYKKKL